MFASAYAIFSGLVFNSVVGILQYETALKADKFLVIAHGTNEEVEKAKSLQAEKKPKFSLDNSKPCYDAYASKADLLEPGNGIFPPSAHNHITVLPEGEQAFQTILDLIQNASHSVYIATFILGKDETGSAIVRALARKASQGLVVCLLIGCKRTGCSQRFTSQCDFD